MQKDEEGIIKNICGDLENTADTLSHKYHKSGMFEFRKNYLFGSHNTFTSYSKCVMRSYKLTESNLIFPEFHQKY